MSDRTSDIVFALVTALLFAVFTAFGLACIIIPNL